MTTDESDGLARNSVTLGEATFVSIATMAPGVGAAFAVIAGAGFAGGALPASVVFALLGCLFVAVAIGQLAKRVTSAAGMSSYLAAAFHGAAGFLGGWGTLLVYAAALPYLALLVGNMVGTSFTGAMGLGYTAWWIIGALVCIALALVMNYLGAQFGTRVGMLLGAAEILVMLVLSVWMVVAAGDRNTLSVFWTTHATVDGFGGMSGIIAGAVYAFLAFIGFDAAAPLGEEARDPRRTIKWAVIGSVLLVGVFFVFTTYASAVYFGPDNYAGFLAYGDGDPWMEITRTFWGAGWVILLITLLSSGLASANGAAMATTRVAWAMGRAGMLPRFLKKTHHRFRSPVAAIAVVFTIAVAVTLGVGLVFGPVSGFMFTGTVLTVAVLPIYMAVCIACPVYYLRFRRSEFRPVVHLVIPALGLLFLFPTFCAGAGITAFSFVAALSYPMSLAGYCVAAWWAIGLAILGYLAVRFPERLDPNLIAGDPGTPNSPEIDPDPQTREAALA
ncbi:APC family permease [Mycolicibacterium sp. 120266]|uniref:APC family permease n=1 Tax=Mycolicibacterium sp. 120266 TaxID=3090601 RepID=UPI00299D5C49|nr:APC family permease [Mycolicibacterium sp. 120266]MDX1875289.1 APC family permease [Mycolicibacterium sp. 120266]